MPRVAIVAALEREVRGLIQTSTPVTREHDGRKLTFFEQDEWVIVCGGIGVQAARRAAEAVIALYHPGMLQSVGFAGALQGDLRVGDIFMPAAVIDARDGSRVEVEGGEGTLVTFMEVAGTRQKASLAQAYRAQAVDMEAAGVAMAARAHGLPFRATKVISDGLDLEIPETARFIDVHGRFKTGGFVLFVASRPWLWRRVAILARNTRKAAKALEKHLKSSARAQGHAVEAKTS